MTLEHVISQLKTADSWECKYKYLIEIGKAMPALEENEKSEDLKVKGCQSQVWLKASLDGGRVKFKGDSDALIVKGLVALLLAAYSDKTPDEILFLQPDFINEIGLAENLSPSRTNGLVAMIKQIKFYAMAFKAKGQV